MNFLTQQQEVASRLRLQISDNNIKTLCQRWLNQSQSEIWRSHDWYFALDRQIVQTVVDKTSGTVSINAGATAVTGASTAFASSDVGSFIQFSSSNDWYKISSQSSATALVIEAPYVGTTNLTAGTYTIRKFFYSLNSAVEKLLSCRQSITPAFVNMVNYREFDIFRPNPTTTGDPLTILVYGVDSSGNIQFSPYPWPSAVENLEFRYKKVVTDLSADADVSLIPAQWHTTVMIEGALYRGYEYLSTGQLVEDARAGRARKGFQDSLEKMIIQSPVDESYHCVIQNKDFELSTVGPILPYKYGVS